MKQLYAGKLPNRKRYCLYFVDGNRITVVAYFVDAFAFNEYLELMGVKNE